MEKRIQKLNLFLILLIPIIAVASFSAGLALSGQLISSVQDFGIAISGTFHPVDLDKDKIYSLINAERKKAGLNELTINPLLEQSAKAKAEDMITKNYWAHNGPNGETPWQFFKDAGYVYTYSGENLAMKYITEETVVQGWMNSPTHRANILKPEFKDMGIYIVVGKLVDEETQLVVNHFASPVPPKVDCLATKCYREWQTYKNDYEKYKNDKKIKNLTQQLDDHYSKFVK